MQFLYPVTDYTIAVIVQIQWSVVMKPEERFLAAQNISEMTLKLTSNSVA